MKKKKPVKIETSFERKGANYASAGYKADEGIMLSRAAFKKANKHGWDTNELKKAFRRGHRKYLKDARKRKNK